MATHAELRQLERFGAHRAHHIDFGVGPNDEDLFWIHPWRLGEREALRGLPYEPDLCRHPSLDPVCPRQRDRGGGDLRDGDPRGDVELVVREVVVAQVGVPKIDLHGRDVFDSKRVDLRTAALEREPHLIGGLADQQLARFGEREIGDHVHEDRPLRVLGSSDQREKDERGDERGQLQPDVVGEEGVDARGRLFLLHSSTLDAKTSLESRIGSSPIKEGRPSEEVVFVFFFFFACGL